MIISVSPNSSSVGSSMRLASTKSGEIGSNPAASRARNWKNASRCDQSRSFGSGIYEKTKPPSTMHTVSAVNITPRITWRSNSSSFRSKPYETQVFDFLTPSMLKSIIFSDCFTVGCAVAVSLFFGDVAISRIDVTCRSNGAAGRARINAAILNSINCAMLKLVETRLNLLFNENLLCLVLRLIMCRLCVKWWGPIKMSAACELSASELSHESVRERNSACGYVRLANDSQIQNT